MAGWRFTFKPREKSTQPELAAITFVASDDAQAGLQQASGIAEGVRFARELANLPPNICNPAYIAAQAEQFAAAHDKVSCTVLDEDKMGELGFGSLLAVGRGSANKPKLVILDYKGGAEGDKPYAFVGKGITFDTGGISLKPDPVMLRITELKLPIDHPEEDLRPAIVQRLHQHGLLALTVPRALGGSEATLAQARRVIGAVA